jgi:hypothetical protein
MLPMAFFWKDVFLERFDLETPTNRCNRYLDADRLYRIGHRQRMRLGHCLFGHYGISQLFENLLIHNKFLYVLPPKDGGGAPQLTVIVTSMN